MQRWPRCLSPLLALMLLAVGPAIAADGRSSEPPASPLPGDAELEAMGAVIGRIRIRNGDVFDTATAGEDGAAYRLVNRLHRRTRSEVIRRHLLFKPGDAYSRRLLEESARLLRGQRYLGDARVEPVRYADGVVDIEVRTRDVWSLNPGASFSRRGGANRIAFELEELNFLGRGIEIDLDYEDTIDRTSHSIGLLHRQAWGDRNVMELRYADNSDGSAWLVGFERPFYALDARWAAGGRLARIDQRVGRFQLGVETSRYRQRARTGELYWGRSAGLHDGWVRRWTLGVSQDEQRFSAATGSPDGLPLPSDRDLVYPWIGIEWLQDRYATWHNRNQIGRTEDVSTGARLAVRLGYASAGLGSDRAAFIHHLEAAYGLGLGDEASLLLGADLRGRQESGRAVDTVLATRARFFLPLSDRSLLFARAEADWGVDLGLDQTLLLGGDNGLRGYPLRYQAGDRRALLSVEQRYFTDWYPFRLFRVGAAAFFDAGRTWGDDGLGTPNYGWLRDAGIGLRLANTRASHGQMIHVDLAFPLDGPRTIDRVQLLVETRREF